MSPSEIHQLVNNKHTVGPALALRYLSPHTDTAISHVPSLLPVLTLADQPMHAYPASQIQGTGVLARRFTTLLGGNDAKNTESQFV